ncbi:MAG: HAMP domain-containing sensor histidine kinase [Acidimicrobiia bacterium]
MTRPRRSLRRRLTVAMVGIALGVLVLTALVTAGIARRTEVSSAKHSVDDRAAVVAPEFDTLVARLPAARAAATTVAGRQQLRRIRDLVATTLRASNGAVVGISADGQVEEVLGKFIGAAEPTVVSLPEGVTAADLDTKALLAGASQTDRSGDTVFTAVPLQETNGVTPVLVLTEHVSNRPFGTSGGAVLWAALISLGVAVLVAAVVARRLSRPIAAMETTAREIAAGDLQARVDTAHLSDDEIGSLGRTINAMATELDDARGHERAFLLSVSHDLRTPLTSIRGYAEAIADGTVEGPDARVRAAGVIASESRRLERLVADLLDLARLDAHQFSLHPGPVDARAVVDDAVAAFAPAAQDVGVTLAMTPGPAVPATADAQRLAQIVANLVENALKYATTTVSVACNARATDVVLTVDDDGPGIPPADLPRVFERLYTSRPAAGRPFGTGIGLAIVRELAHAMGGDARVEPLEAVGMSGTRFVVTLPVGQLPPPPPVA